MTVCALLVEAINNVSFNVDNSMLAWTRFLCIELVWRLNRVLRQRSEGVYFYSFASFVLVKLGDDEENGNMRRPCTSYAKEITTEKISRRLYTSAYYMGIKGNIRLYKFRSI